MTYTNTKKMLIDARASGYTVGAFNIVDYISMEAVLEAAIEKDSPVIIQTSKETVIEMGYEMPPKMMRFLSDSTIIQIALALDYTTDTVVIKKCIDYGWTSVMVDCSSKQFSKNVKITKEIVGYAHKKGVTIAGKLGYINGIENIFMRNSKIQLTNPTRVLDFQKMTGIDSLSVVISTGNGSYNNGCNIDFERFLEITKLCFLPIDIHGCSDLTLEELKKIISYGLSKINISTEIKHVYLYSYKRFIDTSFKNFEENNIYEYEPIRLRKNFSVN